jgi:crotonobetainyl-CoA:carnitine CoA-transferase CaiB-like acyl-CoA transferase
MTFSRLLFLPFVMAGSCRPSTSIETAHRKDVDARDKGWVDRLHWGMTTAKPHAHDTAPLTGIRVLEFCHAIMGPSAGLILADLGADVIKVEPADGDTTRRLVGFAAGFFGTFNRNKRSVAMNLKSNEGRTLLHRLAETADVVIENYAPGTMDRLGCGYGDLSKVNPRLIYCALKGFLSGPYEHRPALDEVVQFMAGLAYMTGPPGQPLRAGSSVVDIMGGMFASASAPAAASSSNPRCSRLPHS